MRYELSLRLYLRLPIVFCYIWRVISSVLLTYCIVIMVVVVITIIIIIKAVSNAVLKRSPITSTNLVLPKSALRDWPLTDRDAQ